MPGREIFYSVVTNRDVIENVRTRIAFRQVFGQATWTEPERTVVIIYVEPKRAEVAPLIVRSNTNTCK